MTKRRVSSVPQTRVPSTPFFRWEGHAHISPGDVTTAEGRKFPETSCFSPYLYMREIKMCRKAPIPQRDSPPGSLCWFVSLPNLLRLPLKGDRSVTSLSSLGSKRARKYGISFSVSFFVALHDSSFAIAYFWASKLLQT